MTKDLFDYAEGVRRREEGIERVTDERRWIDVATDEAVRVIPVLVEPFALEDIKRLLLEDVGTVDAPHHPNAWGALGMRLTRMGVIRPTGKWKRAQSVNAHARCVKLYVWGGR